jgi:hypothetical protein
VTFPRCLPLLAIAFALDAAGAQDTLRERATPVASWNATLIERERCTAKSGTCEVELLLQETNGAPRTLARGMVGEFLVLERSRQVFLCEGSLALEPRGPVLVPLRGSMTLLGNHPGYLRGCGLTGTGEEVLLVYSLVRSGRPYNLVRILDAGGKQIVERRLDEAGDVEFTIAGKTFHANVPSPEPPAVR